jgi:hypothetical protein
MKREHIVFLGALLGMVGFVAGGCSSNSSGCADGGDGGCSTTQDGASAPDTSTPTTDATPDSGLFGFSAGDSCFVVTAVAPGSVDGCELQVADAANTDPANFLPITIPFNYMFDPTTMVGTVILGTNGALGQGTISNNMGALMRAGPTSDKKMTTCTWQQTDTSQLVLTANNTFDVTVTEVESNFAAGCSAPPNGGTCTSTWTWTMTRTTSVTPPLCGAAP